MARYSGELFPELDKNKGGKKRFPKEFKLVHERYIKLTEDKIALIILFVVIMGVGCYLAGYNQGVHRGEKMSSHQIFSSPRVQLKDNRIRVTRQKSQPKLNHFPQDKYLIQLVSYKNKKYAQAEKRKLEKKGYNVIVKTSGEWNIVYAGYYTHKAEAEADLKKLRKIYRDAFIRKTKGGEDE